MTDYTLVYSTNPHLSEVKAQIYTAHSMTPVPVERLILDMLKKIERIEEKLNELTLK